MKNILVISLSNLNSDPRVYKQINSLRHRYNVTTVGFQSSGIKGITHYKFNKNPLTFKKKVIALARLETGMFEKYYWSVFNYAELIDRLSNMNIHLILANDIESLPFATRISKKAKIFYDAHEYAPRQYEDRLKWRFLFQKYIKYLCRQYLPYVSEMTTVCEGISHEFLKEYGISSKVLISASKHVNLKPSDVDSDNIKIIHHGAAHPSRKTELMLEMMHYLDEKYHLYLMLIPVGNGSYYRYLVKKYGSSRNIFFIDPVPMNEIVHTINKYDIAVYLLPPRNFNSKHALPNKFFEFIQARLVVAIGPSVEMEKYVEKYDLGVVAHNFKPESIAIKIKQLSREKIIYYKHQADRYANELSSEKSMAQLNDIVDSMLST